MGKRGKRKGQKNYEAAVASQRMASDYSDGFELARGSEHPWERLKGETQKAFAAFVLYRDMGTNRSVTKVSQELSKSISLIKRWSARWEWVRRIDLYHLYLDRQRQSQILEDVREMPSRQATYGRWLQTKAQERIVKLSPDELTPDQARRFMVDGVKIEQQALSLVDAEELARNMAASGDWRKMLPPGVTEEDVLGFMSRSIADLANSPAEEEE